MKQLGLYCILLIGLYFPSNAQPLDDSPGKKQVLSTAESDACSLLPPAQFQVTAVGTDWVKLRWLPVAGAWGYEIKAYQLPAGLQDTQLVTQATDLELKGLTPGASYRFTIASVCPNLYVSPLLDGETQNLIILELVVNAHGKPPVCPVTIESNQLCMEEPWFVTESGSTYWLQVANSSTCRMFMLKPSLNETIKIYSVNTGNCISPNYEITENDTAAIILLSGTQIATLYFSEISDTQVEICVDVLVTGFSFTYLKNQCSP